MTSKEMIEAHKWLSLMTQGEYNLYLPMVLEFAHSEMGKPRPAGTWLDRFNNWKKSKDVR